MELIYKKADINDIADLVDLKISKVYIIVIKRE